MSNAEISDMGYFGNIWVRIHKFKKAGDSHKGHRHNFDHVTLVAKGGVICEVGEFGGEKTVFTAPTFIVISKDKWHKFTSIEDDTVCYCIYALRDVNGDVTDVFSGDHWPYSSVQVPETHYVPVRATSPQIPLTQQEVFEKLAPTCVECGGCDVE